MTFRGPLPTTFDINRRLLIEVDDNSLAALCRVNPEAAQICRDDNLWKERSELHLLKLLRFKKYYLTWRQFYQEVRNDCYYVLSGVDRVQVFSNPVKAFQWMLVGIQIRNRDQLITNVVTLILAHNSELTDLRVKDPGTVLASYIKLPANNYGFPVGFYKNPDLDRFPQLTCKGLFITREFIVSTDETYTILKYYRYIAPLITTSLNYLRSLTNGATSIGRVDDYKASAETFQTELGFDIAGADISIVQVNHEYRVTAPLHGLADEPLSILDGVFSINTTAGDFITFFKYGDISQIDLATFQLPLLPSL